MEAHPHTQYKSGTAGPPAESGLEHHIIMAEALKGKHVIPASEFFT